MDRCRSEVQMHTEARLKGVGMLLIKGGAEPTYALPRWGDEAVQRTLINPRRAKSWRLKVRTVSCAPSLSSPISPPGCVLKAMHLSALSAAEMQPLAPTLLVSPDDMNF